MTKTDSSKMSNKKNPKSQRVKGVKRAVKIEVRPRPVIRKRLAAPIYQAKVPKAMVANPSMTTTKSTAPIVQFLKTFTDPGCVVAPPFDDSHQLPMASAVAAGSLTYTLDNDAKHYLVFLRTAVSGLYSGSTATQFLPWATTSFNSGSTMGLADLSGNSAGRTWADVYGATTSSAWIFPWATKIQLIFNVPQSVLQGQMWTGNLPLQQLIGRTVEDLKRIADKVRPDQGGSITIKNTLVELGNFHERPTTFPTAAKDLDPNERISYILIGPRPVGSIGGGTAPTTYDITITGKSNYAWLPVYDPAITRTLETKMKLDMEHMSTADDVAKLKHAVEVAAPCEEIKPWTDEEKKMHEFVLKHGPELEEARRGKRTLTDKVIDGFSWVSNKVIQHYGRNHANHLPFSAGPEAVTYHDPLDRIPLSGYSADCTYYLNSINTRWEIDNLPIEIQTLAQRAKSALEEMRDLCNVYDAESIQLLNEYPDSLRIVDIQEGKKIYRRFNVEGIEYKKPGRSQSTDRSYKRL